MNQQCNSCGGFFGIEKCPTCNTLICERCRTNHENGCGQAQTMKSLGLGPTVRAVEPTVQAVDAATGLPVFDAPFHFEITAAQQEPSIEMPIPVLETVDGVPVVFAVDPTPLQTLAAANAVEVISGEAVATVKASADSIVDAVTSVSPAEAPAILEAVMTDLTGIFDSTVGTAVGVSPEVATAVEPAVEPTA